MSNMKETQEFIRELRSCIPKPFFNKLEETQKGIGFVLIYLEESNGEVIAGDIARELNVSTARIAVLLKKLEDKGLIERYSSSKDARRTIVKITSAGITYADRIKEQVLTKVELLFKKVGKEELKEFIRISGKIKTAIEE